MRVILPMRVHTVIATKGATSDLLCGRPGDFVVSSILALTDGRTILD